jgi:hypothetical protein
VRTNTVAKKSGWRAHSRLPQRLPLGRRNRFLNFRCGPTTEHEFEQTYRDRSRRQSKHDEFRCQGEVPELIQVLRCVVHVMQAVA